MMPRWRSPEKINSWKPEYWVRTHQRVYRIDYISETEDLGIEGSNKKSFSSFLENPSLGIVYLLI